MGYATLLLNVLQAVNAGFELKALVDAVHEKEKNGASPEEINSYIESLADEALDKLKTLST